MSSAENRPALDINPTGGLRPLRALGRRLLGVVTLSFAAGLLVFVLEVADRLRVLRPNFWGAGDAARFVALSAATVVFVAAAAAVFGTGWSLADAVVSAVDRTVGARLGRWRRVASFAIAVLAVSAVLRIVSGLVPWALQYPVVRVLLRIDRRLYDLGLIAEYPRVVFTVMLVAAVAAFMLVHAMLYAPRGRRTRWIAAVAAAGCAAAVIGGYFADSRIEFTRYEFMFHVPIEVISSVVAMIGCVALARVAGDPDDIALSRPVVVVALLSATLGVGSIAYGAAFMDSNQNVKALFWNRSIVARRVFQAARLATDRDGDGFASTFGGGDTDDGNASVHPMAAEVPGNGVDDNGIGGDLAASEFEAGSLYGTASNRPDAAVAARPSTPTAVRNVLILSVDCLRADHLGAYGYRRPTSPNLDAFAAESLLFEHAYAQGTNTGHSFTSMYRSSYADDIFDERIGTFARQLVDAGYSAQFLNAVRTDAWLNAQRWGKYKTLMEDFEVLHNDGERVWDAAELTDQAVAAIDAQPRERPHLTWVHYFDCHRPRRRHAEHDFGRSAAGVFDSNVAFVDRHLGRLFEHLRSTGRLDDTIVFIIADHGEAFMEHGAMDHSNKPYENNTLVPLIVRVPGAVAGRYEQPVGLIDVGPTALAFAGLDVPPWYRGIDLVGAVSRGPLPSRTIVSETPRNLIESSFYSWALVDWPYKIVWDVRSNTTEIFDLSNDPGEVRSLADRDPALAERLRRTLGEWLDRETARTGAVGPGDEGISDDAGD